MGLIASNRVQLVDSGGGLLTAGTLKFRDNMTIDMYTKVGLEEEVSTLSSQAPFWLSASTKCKRSMSLPSSASRIFLSGNRIVSSCLRSATKRTS